MLQAHQNTIQVIATALGVLSVFWGLLVVLFSLVDPIAPMFAYFAIPFILLSLVFGCKGWLMVKLFGALFILSHCLAFWTIHDIESKATVVKSSEPFNEDVFIRLF
jgi:hypothetical protein